MSSRRTYALGAAGVLATGLLVAPALASPTPTPEPTPTQPVEEPTTPPAEEPTTPPVEPPAPPTGGDFGPWLRQPVLSEPIPVEACGTTVTISAVEATWSAQFRERDDEFGNHVVQIRGITEVTLDPEVGQTLTVDVSGEGTATIDPDNGLLQQTGSGNWVTILPPEVRDDAPGLPEIYLTDGPFTHLVSGANTEDAADDRFTVVSQPEAVDVCAMFTTGVVPTAFQPAVDAPETPTPTDPPTDPTDPPTDPTDPPTDPTDPPTDPTDSPTDPTDSPTDPTDSPTDPTDPPADPTDPPTPPASPSSASSPSGGSGTTLKGVLQVQP